MIRYSLSPSTVRGPLWFALAFTVVRTWKDLAGFLACSLFWLVFCFVVYKLAGG